MSWKTCKNRVVALGRCLLPSIGGARSLPADGGRRPGVAKLPSTDGPVGQNPPAGWSRTTPWPAASSSPSSSPHRRGSKMVSRWFTSLVWAAPWSPDVTLSNTLPTYSTFKYTIPEHVLLPIFCSVYHSPHVYKVCCYWD